MFQKEYHYDQSLNTGNTMTSARSCSHSNCIQISIKIPPSRL